MLPCIRTGVTYTPANSIRPQSSNGAQRAVKSASLSSVESLDKRRQSRAQDCKSNISLFSHRTEEIRRGASVLKRADVDRYMSICGSRMYKKFCSKTVDLHLVDRKCQRQDEMRFLTQEEAGKRGLFMLASYPGSGNTWSRLILEELTGIYTGSIFCDHLIAFSGHFGEGFAVRETIAVKAHSALGRIRESPRSVIYLVRNPFHSLLSSLSWKSTKSHTISNHKGKLYVLLICFQLFTSDLIVGSLTEFLTCMCFGMHYSWHQNFSVYKCRLNACVRRAAFGEGDRGICPTHLCCSPPPSSLQIIFFAVYHYSPLTLLSLLADT